ncbi:MAG: TIGR03619 family F420-dependent LLM class oxidoreductase [Proteobacteria bacterium]|jgi:probable F420-dependent oxidoreductase|nr:TIGR03619 family F420-dependent LLM class oxidoreductase [Pseudomonadota bacterium]MDC1127666.1 TIGR03619 family F420-dependent LLM class oxidoreductase [Gammaproteobacteria bacterium]MBT5066334.1 TIGR03619 family F420-dependent LLM class oxidoreductase [Pseudomonadota bacterium]MBT6192057.1 TIGR03619 family F420-dependent LLM class oxidoreductase [Pseudomonadota bacterium]MBT6464478.1 TIGR03619 family F420-dependent LLM class oxidoreductase [Pseudomonadota bacterium]
MVRFGICVLPTDLIPPAVEIAQTVESKGLDMLFFAENSHVPVVHRKNSYHRPEMVQPFARMHDSITALAACAAVTTRIQLGTGVCLLTERDPIITAKSIATLDHISQGRVIFGIAGGWIKEAIENHGCPFRERWAVVRERALAIRALWQTDPTEFHGDYVDFKPLTMMPKPFQKGGPPIYIGSNSSKVPARVVDYADGWMPIYEKYEGDPLVDIKAACEKAGRDPSEITTLLFGAPRDQLILQDYATRGCAGFIFLIPPEQSGNLIPILDEIKKLRDAINK